MSKSPVKCPLEDAEQYCYIQWLDAHKILYFAVPNVVKFASKLKSKLGRIKFWQQRKKEGVKKGVPDLVVFLDNKILFIEMKRVKGSTVGDEQIRWVDKINGYKYAFSAICYGAKMAIDVTKEQIKS